MFAVLKAGGAYVGLDRDYPVPRVNELLRDSGATVLVSTAELAARVRAPAELVLVDRDAERITAESSARLDRPERSDQLAYIIYTSGSTGTPKGVMVEHRNVTSFFVGVESAIRLDASGVWLASASICFDMSTIEILASLCHGARLVVLGQAVLGEVGEPALRDPGARGAPRHHAFPMHAVPGAHADARRLGQARARPTAATLDRRRGLPAGSRRRAR